MELLSFHTMQFHIWVNYYGSIQIISHPFTSLFPINMIFECHQLVPFSGLCTQQLYNSVNYFLKKTHLTIKWPSFFPLSRKYGEVKVSKHQQTFRVWSWFPCRTLQYPLRPHKWCSIILLISVECITIQINLENGTR